MFKKPEAEIVLFAAQDIVTTSNPTGGEPGRLPEDEF